VIASYQTVWADRCIDIFARPDGTFGFEEFRSDPEDMGAWTPMSSFAAGAYPTVAGAVTAARSAVPWLDALLDGPSRGGLTPLNKASVTPGTDRAYGGSTTPGPPGT